MGVGDILLYENWKKNPFLEKEFLDNRSYAGVVFLLLFGICNGGTVPTAVKSGINEQGLKNSLEKFVFDFKRP